MWVLVSTQPPPNRSTGTYSYGSGGQKSAVSLPGLESGVGRAGFSWGSREKPLLVSSSFQEPRPWLLAPSVHLSSFSRPPVSGFDSRLPLPRTCDHRGPTRGVQDHLPSRAPCPSGGAFIGFWVSMWRSQGRQLVCFGGFQEHSHKELGFASFFLLTFELLYLSCL